MDSPTPFRCAVLSVVKHDYVARGMASHPRFELVVVADDPGVPNWAHERNQKFADAWKIPYVRDIERALRESNAQVAIVSAMMVCRGGEIVHSQVAAAVAASSSVNTQEAA